MIRMRRRGLRISAIVVAVLVAGVGLVQPASALQGEYRISIQVYEGDYGDDRVSNVGDPGSDVAVQVYQIPGEALIEEVTTDDDGLAEVSGLEAGYYQLAIAEAPRGCSAFPGPVVRLADDNPSPEATLVIECGQSAWYLLSLLALPAVTVPGDPTP